MFDHLARIKRFIGKMLIVKYIPFLTSILHQFALF